MKIQYLGTAAYEGIPSLFCDCTSCKRSRELGGKNIRTRSQALIDDKLLVDFPPDTFLHSLQFGISMSDIHSCIITHSHCDHLYIQDITIRKQGFSNIDNLEPLTFYSDKSGYGMIQDNIDKKGLSADEVGVSLITLNVPFHAEGYRITPIRAAHAPDTSPVVYIIEKDGKSILYSNDTSEYPEESWNYLKNSGVSFDMISLDCTAACLPITYVGHMDLSRCIAIRDKFYEYGLADDKTIFVLNHFSHNGTDVVYDDFLPIATENNFLVSYDGMIIEI